MFIFTKNKIDEFQITQVEKNIISKKELGLKDALIIKQPNHLNLVKDFNILEYQYLYETDDYIIHENESLLNHLKNLEFEDILKVLDNTHKDSITSEEIISYIINNNTLTLEFLTNIEEMLKELSMKIYYKNKFNPNTVIKQMRYELKLKNELSNIEKIKFEILKDRTTRWMLLKIKRQIQQLKLFFQKEFEFSSLDDLLQNNKYYLYISSKEYSSIYNKEGIKTINSIDLFTNYRYRDLKDLKDGSSVNYKKLKHIYIASNKYILKKVKYIDFLNDENSIKALCNLFNTFNSANLTIEDFNEDFLKRASQIDNFKLNKTIANNFSDFIKANTHI